MCGISGVLALAGAPSVDRREIERMTDALAHRGPDGSGVWLADDQRVGFGHRRLTILDLTEAGAQPMRHPQPRLWVTFNGEIYNFPELRASLEAGGARFRSRCDTEVLLHLYAVHGERMVDYLCGMFAFAIWDESRRRLFLARDPLGIKPLYWSSNERIFRFASEVRALVTGSGVKGGVSTAGIVGFLTLGYVPEPHTIVDGIYALPAGHMLSVDENGVGEPKSFFSVSQILAEAEDAFGTWKPTKGELIERVGAALSASVKRHLLSDVPVGIFLSSGLDSTSLAAFAGAASNGPIRTVTLGFEELQGYPEDETVLAEVSARALGTDHATCIVRGADFYRDFDRILAAMDQPSIDGVNTWFVSKVVAGAGFKVALSGLGGDELFGSYPSFRQIPRLVRVVGLIPQASRIGRAFRIVSANLIRRLTSPKYAGMLEYGYDYASAYLLRRGLFMPWELPEIIDPDIAKEGWAAVAPLTRLRDTTALIHGARACVTALETVWYMRNQLLRDTDWASMAHSLEVRTPFVDSRVFSEFAPLIVSRHPPSKRHMVASLPRVLPSQLVERKKTGFVVPIREWLVARSNDPATFERGFRGWARLILSRNLSTASVLVH